MSELEFDPLNPAAAAAAHPLSAPFAELIESPLQQMDADRLNQKNRGVAGYVEELLSARSKQNKEAKAMVDAAQALSTCIVMAGVKSA